MTIEIYPAQKSDAKLILDMIIELAVYEKAREQVLASVEDIERSLFGPGACSEALICTVNGEPAGYAVFFMSYSTWLGKNGIYLEDLYVAPKHRGAGAGKTLLRHIARAGVRTAVRPPGVERAGLEPTGHRFLPQHRRAAAGRVGALSYGGRGADVLRGARGGAAGVTVIGGRRPPQLWWCDRFTAGESGQDQAGLRAARMKIIGRSCSSSSAGLAAICCALGPHSFKCWMINPCCASGLI